MSNPVPVLVDLLYLSYQIWIYNGLIIIQDSLYRGFPRPLKLVLPFKYPSLKRLCLPIQESIGRAFEVV